jgi:hypothetical protein
MHFIVSAQILLHLSSAKVTLFRALIIRFSTESSIIASNLYILDIVTVCFRVVSSNVFESM